MGNEIGSKFGWCSTLIFISAWSAGSTEGLIWTAAEVGWMPWDSVFAIGSSCHWA